MKSKTDDVIAQMLASGWFRVRSGRVETCYQWRAVREYTVPWFVCDRLDGKGYRYVSFRGVRVKAHRVAYALYHNTGLGGLEINHIDGCKLNNSRSNLELCTPQRQSLHALELGLNKNIGINHVKAKLTPSIVRKARKLRARGASYVDLSRKFGVSPPCIRYAVTGHTWSHVT